MRSVFEASTGLDAHMILNLLQTYGIPGRIEGEYLQGGVGELQAIGLVRVLVSEQDYNRPKEIVDEWESIQPPLDSSRAEARSSGSMMFIAGFIAGAVVMFWILKGHH
ncbi:MAG: DUF2007 domain-containing protein [Gallionella sp.]